MLNYIRIYRPVNILFIALAQWLNAYYLDFSASLTSISSGGIYWLMLGTAACAAFGYWINDYLDTQRDSINKPNRLFINRFPKIAVYLHFLVFILVALLSGNKLSLYFLLVFTIVILCLFIYSRVLKDIAGLGNLVIAALSFYSIYLVSLLFVEVDNLPVLSIFKDDLKWKPASGAHFDESAKEEIYVHAHS